MKPIMSYQIVPSLPEELSRLRELAYNLRWAWDHETIDLFRRMDRDLWETTNHNPAKMLGELSQQRLQALARDDGFLAHLERAAGQLDEYVTDDKTWYAKEFGAAGGPLIAYFSAEFGISECVPIYSGGLGILAGDHLKSASDLGIPLVGVGLLYQQGYFRQYLNMDGWQQELYPENDFYTMPLTNMTDDQGKPLAVGVELPGRTVYACIWHVQVGRVSLYLLDTNIPLNQRTDQDITDQLYVGDRERRIQQEIILGIGGVRALQALGLSPSVCHMNEGHSAFLALERCRQMMETHALTFAEAATITSVGNVFTTHTPVTAGNEYFALDLVEKYFQVYRGKLGLSKEEFLALGQTDPADKTEEFCMTVLALRLSACANGVSRLHGEVARRMWQNVWPDVPEGEVPISSITNGVHASSWVSNDMAGLYDRYLGPRWRLAPGDLRIWNRVHEIPAEELWRTHERRRERLVAFARRRLAVQLERRGAPPSEIEEASEALDPEALTVGFARRFATYKRATLLLHDPERFKALLLHPERPIQFIFAGKAHPLDSPGKEFIRALIHFARESGCRGRIVFIEDYDMVVARYLVQGVDVWLNTPRRPQEASGTSGMKAAMNGALNLSILDGWWAEAYRYNIGWAIGRGEQYEDHDLQDSVEANALYQLLERDIAPMFYMRGPDGLPREWINRVKAAMRELCPIYNTARMVQDYTVHFYDPAIQRCARFDQDDMAAGKAFADWQVGVASAWGDVRIGQVRSEGDVLHVGDLLRVTAEVYLGRLTPDDVEVQLYEGPINTEGSIESGRATPMSLASSSKDGWHHYQTETACEYSGRHGFTVRVLPQHADMPRSLRLRLITWAGQEAGGE
jgi:starch phosphorylase